MSGMPRHILFLVSDVGRKFPASKNYFPVLSIGNLAVSTPFAAENERSKDGTDVGSREFPVKFPVCREFL